jgi:hypothetical protein
MRNDIAADHAIVEAVADDDRAVMERLAALEAEVKAESDVQRARKAAAVAKLRDQRVTQTAAEPSVRKRTAASEPPPAAAKRKLVSRAIARDDDDDDAGGERPASAIENLTGDSLDIGGALELASKANRVKQELQRAPKQGEKSWIISGVASLALGPAGWLYAGSLREAAPAAAAWIGAGLLASKILPMLILMPVLMVVAPLSAIAGVVYALQYNRTGRRQRLFGKKPEKSQNTLPAPRAVARGKLRDGS